METLTIYEAGVRSPEGRNATFMTSPDLNAVEEYFEIMQTTVASGFECFLREKNYHLVSTTPRRHLTK